MKHCAKPANVSASAPMQTRTNPSKKSGRAQRGSCRYCGEVHRPRECPAYGKKSQRCGLRNHYAAVCMTQLQHSIRQAHDETVRQVYTCDDEGTCKPTQQESSRLSKADWAFMMISLEANESDGRGADIYNIIADKASSTHATKAFTCLEKGGTSVKFQLDTGASCNIIGRHHLPTKIELHLTSKVLTMYNRSTIIPLGLHQTIVRNPKTNTKHSVEFVVIEEQTPFHSSGQGHAKQ